MPISGTTDPIGSRDLHKGRTFRIVVCEPQTSRDRMVRESGKLDSGTFSLVDAVWAEIVGRIRSGER
jgi:hypothetical protein